MGRYENKKNISNGGVSGFVQHRNETRVSAKGGDFADHRSI
jgi:hypothetical protein